MHKKHYISADYLAIISGNVVRIFFWGIVVAKRVIISISEADWLWVDGVHHTGRCAPSVWC